MAKYKCKLCPMEDCRFWLPWEQKCDCTNFDKCELYEQVHNKGQMSIDFEQHGN